MPQIILLIMSNKICVLQCFLEKCLSLSMEFSNILFNSSLELKSIEEGEIIKLASNSYRDLSFAFSKEFLNIQLFQTQCYFPLATLKIFYFFLTEDYDIL